MRTDPVRARQQGPPNWLVTERRHGDKEPFLDAAQRVLREDFEAMSPVSLDGVGTENGVVTDVPGEMSPVGDVPTICPQCGERPKEPKRAMCGACRKRAYRERKK